MVNKSRQNVFLYLILNIILYFYDVEVNITHLSKNKCILPLNKTKIKPIMQMSAVLSLSLGKSIIFYLCYLKQENMQLIKKNQKWQYYGN